MTMQQPTIKKHIIPYCKVSIVYECWNSGDIKKIRELLDLWEKTKELEND